MPSSVLALQTETLLQRLKDDAEQRCNRLRTTASSQEREILRAARAQARAEVHNAIVEERSRTEQRLRQTEARLDLDDRQRAQREIRAGLERMWSEIPSALEDRWRDPERRREWIEAALAAAGVLLGGRAWRITHGSGWPEADSRVLEDLARSAGCGSLECASDPAIRAGLRITAPGVCFDATVAGLTSRRAAIESAFLAEYLSPPREAEPPTHE